MSETKTLYNKGQRHIRYGQHKDAVFKPKTAVKFTPETADYISKLYPDEISDSDTVQEAFEDPATSVEGEEGGEGSEAEGTEGSEAGDNKPRRGRRPQA